MRKITLHRDDLEKILKFVDELNPANDTAVGAGYVTIHQSGNSGIGSLVDASVSIKVGNNYGTFKRSIVDESSW